MTPIAPSSLELVFESSRTEKLKSGVLVGLRGSAPSANYGRTGKYVLCGFDGIFSELSPESCSFSYPQQLIGPTQVCKKDDRGPCNAASRPDPFDDVLAGVSC